MIFLILFLFGLLLKNVPNVDPFIRGIAKIFYVIGIGFIFIILIGIIITFILLIIGLISLFI